MKKLPRDLIKHKNPSPGKPVRIILLPLLLAAVLLSGCLPVYWPEKTTYTLPETRPAEQTASAPTTAVERTTTATETTTSHIQDQTAPAATTTRVSAARKSLDDDFDKLAENLILSGLAEGLREISLDPLFAAYQVDKTLTDEAIARIYSAYRQVYAGNPQFFYLSGAVSLNYFVSSDETALVQKGVLLPQYWPAMEQEDDRVLAETRSRLEQIAADLAAQISRQTDIPWQRLRLLHNWLVREIEYDTDGSQDMNNIAGAFLAGKTLCQGYAQAFQLTGQLMGFNIILITGESEGIGHAWNLVYLDGNWYHVDVTHDDPVPDSGSRPPQHLHFLRSDKVMAQTHIWQKEDYPAAARDGAHYYQKSGLTVSDRDDLAGKLAAGLQAAAPIGQEKILLEWLYTGSDLPSRADLDAILTAALQEAAIYQQIFYRAHAGKSVVLFEISAGNG